MERDDEIGEERKDKEECDYDKVFKEIEKILEEAKESKPKKRPVVVIRGSWEEICKRNELLNFDKYEYHFPDITF